MAFILQGMNPIFFNSVVLVMSLGIITTAGLYFVNAITDYAKKLGMSNYFVGMVIIAVATSSPDIATAIAGIMVGNPEIMSGVVLGGLAIDLALMNGLLAMLKKKIKLDTGVIKDHEFIILGLLLLPFVLMLDGEITRSEGFAMVLSFVIYILLIWRREEQRGKLKRLIPVRVIWQDAVVFLLALTSMLLAARYAVFSASNLSAFWHIPMYILSITLFALVNSLPDIFSSVISILKNDCGEIGFGECIGTTMIEVNLFTGIVAMIRPVHFNVVSTIVGTIALMVSATYFLMIMRKGVIKRSQGFVFLAIYAVYIFIEISRVTWWAH